jgi:RimJ/RimL family protein N-acetyltransferase
VAILTGVAWPPEPLTTERLVLRRTQASDRAAYVELWCSEDVRRFLGGAHAREAIEEAMPAVPSAHAGVFAVELDGDCVGTVMIERRDADVPGHLGPEGNELEVNYLLLPEHWGRGLASEAVAAMLDWTWTHFPDEPVVICTQVANERSLALARRLGFSEAARFEAYGAEQWLGVRFPDPAR